MHGDMNPGEEIGIRIDQTLTQDATGTLVMLEQNYIRRPLDLLRMWHVKIEAWILEQAGIDFAPVAAGLRVVISS